MCKHISNISHQMFFPLHLKPAPPFEREDLLLLPTFIVFVQGAQFIAAHGKQPVSCSNDTLGNRDSHVVHSGHLIFRDNSRALP